MAPIMAVGAFLAANLAAAGTAAASAGIGATIGAASSAITLGSTIKSILDKPSDQSTKVDTAKQDKQSLNAAYAEAQKMRKRQGASSTILTGPLGATGSPQTTQATLGA